MNPIRTVLVDDHTLVREALCEALLRVADIKVVGTAASAFAMWQVIADTAPDVIVMDIGMPGLNGIEATARLHQRHPGIKVIGLSAHAERQFITGMLTAGASGYVVKSASGSELVRAIHAVMDGKTFLCPVSSSALIDAVRSAENGNNGSNGNNGNGNLGKREREVLRLLADGFSSAEIGLELQIASSTVDVHRRNIMRKLDIHTVAGLTKYAVRAGIATLD